MSHIAVPVTNRHTQSPPAQRGNMDQCPTALALIDYGFSRATAGESHVIVETHEGATHQYYTGHELCQAIRRYDAGGPFPQGTLVTDVDHEQIELQTSNSE